MTTLKSLELKGNKLSFANFISNLSPCDTPFTSMIGKEAIDQSQYSWQLDALDTPRNTAHEEGSEAVADKREGTHELHNFTSILRKVAKVSDTVASMSTYGRNKEMQYQLGKTGKELKRDLEFMTLNNGEGNIGTGALASKFSGFEFLCAPEGYVDFSTGAVTRKSISVGDLTGPWFKASDLFDLTYNLFLAGAKANKVMFHPSHATTFSDFVSNNIESTNTYRMFDNLDTKYNVQITKIRDPLGQNYDLIPNRYMPKDKIYIFNENDWTQMILRAPAVTKLSKQGSSERYMLETEIGLRHRHINASGVLNMNPSSLLMEWLQKPTPITWGLNNTTDIAEISIKDRATGLPIVDGTAVSWTSSNEAVLELTDSVGATNGGEATNVLKPIRPGTSVVTVTCGDSSASYRVTVADPLVKLTMSNNLAEKGQRVLAVVQVLNADGTAVKDGVTVSFSADPSTLVELESITAVTTGGSGTAEIGVTALQKLGLVQVQARVGTVNSNHARLEIVEKVEQLSMLLDQRIIAHGVNDSAVVTLSVRDASGNAIPNKNVSLLATDDTIVHLPSNLVNTGGSGEASIRITAGNIGNSLVSAGFGDQEIDIRVFVTAPVISLNAPSPVPMNAPFQMSAIVTRSDDTDIVGVDVSFTGEPAFSPAVEDVTTNARGVAEASYTPTTNSDIVITASVGAYSDTIDVSVNMA